MATKENIDFLIKFDEEGNRGETYARVIHYKKADDDFVKEKLAAGFIFVSKADYNKLMGNVDKQIYIRKSDGTFVPKPEYVPSAEEEQQANLAKLDAEYAQKLADNKNQLIEAVTVNQDAEYAAQLREERKTIQTEYATKRGEL